MDHSIIAKDHAEMLSRLRDGTLHIQHPERRRIADTIERQRKLLDSCRKAMGVSQRFHPNGTNWSHMVAAIDAELDAPCG